MMGKNLKLIVYLLIIVLVGAILGYILFYESNSVNTSNTHPGQYWIDVPYANASPSEKMDIFLPNSTGPYPVIIWIHGGGFETGNKNENSSKPAKEGLSRGYAVVSINYRSSREATFPAQINDVKAAIQFLRANSKKYNLNPDKIGLWGSSAGGFLAALARNFR